MSLAVIETRKVPTRLVLCVVSKTIPDSKLMPDVYRLLEFLTGGPVSTSQLAAAMHEANRFLSYRNPNLTMGLDGVVKEDAESVHAWFEQQLNRAGAMTTVVRN